MGSFFGHALPGAFFILFASWWMVQIFRSFYRSLQKRGQNFESSVTWPVRVCGGRRVNIEAWVVLVAVILGMFVELVAAPIKNNGTLYMGNIQHGTMYFFFGLTACSALIAPKVKIMSDHRALTYICLFIAYTAEGLLFKLHLFGREGLDVHLHILLVYTIFGSSFVTLFEIKYRHSVLLPLVRTFLTILQGTWFWQAGFILYPPFSDPWGTNDSHGHTDHSVGEEMQEEPHTDHNALMLATCAYTWHAAVIFIIMLVTGSFIGRYYQRHGGIDQVALHRHGNTGVNGYTALDNDVDDI